MVLSAEEDRPVGWDPGQLPAEQALTMTLTRGWRAFQHSHSFWACVLCVVCGVHGREAVALTLPFSSSLLSEGHRERPRNIALKVHKYCVGRRILHVSTERKTQQGIKPVKAVWTPLWVLVLPGEMEACSVPFTPEGMRALAPLKVCRRPHFMGAKLARIRGGRPDVWQGYWVTPNILWKPYLNFLDGLSPQLTPLGLGPLVPSCWRHPASWCLFITMKNPSVNEVNGMECTKASCPRHIRLCAWALTGQFPSTVMGLGG